MFGLVRKCMFKNLIITNHSHKIWDNFFFVVILVIQAKLITDV